MTRKQCKQKACRGFGLNVFGRDDFVNPVQTGTATHEGNVRFSSNRTITVPRLGSFEGPDCFSGNAVDNRVRGGRCFRVVRIAAA